MHPCQTLSLPLAPPAAGPVAVADRDTFKAPHASDAVAQNSVTLKTGVLDLNVTRSLLATGVNAARLWAQLRGSGDARPAVLSQQFFPLCVANHTGTTLHIRTDGLRPVALAPGGTAGLQDRRAGVGAPSALLLSTCGRKWQRLPVGRVGTAPLAMGERVVLFVKVEYTEGHKLVTVSSLITLVNRTDTPLEVCDCPVDRLGPGHPA